MHKVLVSKLKKEQFNLTVKCDEEERENDKEAYLAIDKIGKTIDDRFNIDAMADSCVGGRVKSKDVSKRINKKIKSNEKKLKAC